MLPETKEQWTYLARYLGTNDWKQCGPSAVRAFAPYGEGYATAWTQYPVHFPQGLFGIRHVHESKGA